MAATGTSPASTDPRDRGRARRRNGERAARAVDVGAHGRLELARVAGEPPPMTTCSAPATTSSWMARAMPCAERRRRRRGQLVTSGRGRERASAAAPRPHPVQRRARRDGLEAADLAARARHVPADGQVADLAGRAVDAADAPRRVHDRGGEPGAEVEVGRACRSAIVGPHRVVRAERRGLDVVLDARRRPGAASMPPRGRGTHPEVDGVPGPPGRGVDEAGHAGADVADGAPARRPAQRPPARRRTAVATSCAPATGGRRDGATTPPARRARAAAVLVPPMSMPSLTGATSPPSTAEQGPRHDGGAAEGLEVGPAARPAALDDDRRRGPPREAGRATAHAG